MINTEDISLTDKISWKEWLDSITPIAEKLIGEMNSRAISVKRVRAWFNDPHNKDSLPPDLPGIYGFFHPDPSNKKPLIKFGESFELFARVATHLGVRPNRNCCPERYLKEMNSFSGDSSFRIKIARALNILDESKWQGKNSRSYKREFRNERSELALKVNETIDKYRITWQSLIIGRADLQTWVEWNNDEPSSFRSDQMGPNKYQASLKPAFDRSLFAKDSGYWEKLLAI